MAIEPGGPFTIEIEGMGRRITVSRLFDPSELSRGDLLESAPGRLAKRLAARPAKSMAWTATEVKISVTLTYIEAHVAMFVDSDVDAIIAACQTTIDECLGIDPTHDKGVE